MLLRKSMDIKVIWIFIIGVLLIFISYLNRLQEKVTNMNEKLKKIYKHMKIEDKFEEAINEEIKGLILNGEKFKAIKVYRQHTGLGLKEAKEYVDSLSEEIKKAQ